MPCFVNALQTVNWKSMIRLCKSFLVQFIELQTNYLVVNEKPLHVQQPVIFNREHLRTLISERQKHLS